MKNLLLCFIVLLCTLSATAQAPQAFNYQGIARDGSGAPIADQTISLRLSIQSGTLPRSIVYQETHTVLTNKFGVFTTEVGRGNPQIGIVEDIDWGADNHYIQIEMDPEGGSNYTLMGESELLSVPYALYAGKGPGGESLWQENARGIHYNDGNVGIGTDNPEHKLSLLSNDPNGDDRILVTLKNESTSNRSWAAMRLAAGNSNSYTYLNHHASSYDYDGSKYTDFGQLSSTGKGLILRADRADGVIKFLAGGDPLSPSERMRITGKGFVGIGTETPKSKLTIEGNDPILEGRNYIRLYNKSLSNRSNVYISLSAGDDEHSTYLTHHSETYDLDGFLYANFGQLESRGGGLNLVASHTDGVLRFFTAHDLATNLPLERMRLSSEGNFGIGTKQPASRLQISHGDVYIEDINNGVIMKSPNGSCWRMTVNDDGTFKSTLIACPN